MVCVPERSIIPSLKLGDYLSVQAHKPSEGIIDRSGTQTMLYLSLKHVWFASQTNIFPRVCVGGGGGGGRKGDIAGGNY